MEDAQRWTRRTLLRRVALLGLIFTPLAVLLQPWTIAAQPPPAVTVFALTTTNRLLQFLSTSPGTIRDANPITGLQPAEELLGIDFRPATGELFALGKTNHLYTIDTGTGAATVINKTSVFTPTLLGTAFGFDFNPRTDRIRVVSKSLQNVQVRPDTGKVSSIDGPLAYAPGDSNFGKEPGAVAAAYTDNVVGAARTTLYIIDSRRDALLQQGGGGISANTGQLFTIGDLGFEVDNFVGFDIAQSGVAYASLTAPLSPSSVFATVDLANGQVTPLGNIGGGETIAGLAVVLEVKYRVYVPLIAR